MKVSCEKNLLVSAISVASRTVAPKSAITALEGIYVRAGVKLVLSGYNLETGITVTVPAEITEPGECIMPARLFFDIIRKLPGDAVSLAVDEKFKVQIRSGIASFSITAMSAEDYPELPDVDSEKGVRIPQNALKAMIGGTIFSVSENQARPIHTGCLFEVENDAVTMVAVDGYRLALRRAKCSDVLEKFSAIIPGRAVGDIGKLLSDDEEAFAQLSFGGNKLHIKLENTEIYVILIEGEYVQYRQILPKAFATRVEVELDPFRRCIDRAALIAREGSNNLIMLRIEGGSMVIEAHSQIGDVREELPTRQEGADLSIAFNVKYLTDVVRFIDGDSIELNLNNAVSPCIVTPVGDSDYVHLILPVRTGGR